MQTQRAYLVGTHRYSYLAGTPGEVLGLVILTPKEGEDPRPCYHVRYPEGKEDYVAIVDSQHYEIISETDLKEGRIPAVVH